MPLKRKENRMKITLLLNGKTDKAFIREGMAMYESRIKRYVPFEIKAIASPKNTKSLTAEQYRNKETAMMQKHIQPSDHIILLDEKGQNLDSKKFATFLQQKMNRSLKNLVFVVGGPYGFSGEMQAKAHGKISLSEMTFSHQVVRILLTEQLYRAMTILNNEPYHNE